MSGARSVTDDVKRKRIWRFLSETAVADADDEAERVVHTFDDIVHVVTSSNAERVGCDRAKLLYAARVVANLLFAFEDT